MEIDWVVFENKKQNALQVLCWLHHIAEELISQWNAHPLIAGSWRDTLPSDWHVTFSAEQPKSVSEGIKKWCSIAGVQNHTEWSENCENMALFHLDRPDLATSQHLLHCAELRLKQAKDAPLAEIKEREISLALTWAKWYIRQLAESCEEKRRPGSYKPPARVLPESLR